MEEMQAITQAMEECRAETLRLLACIPKTVGDLTDIPYAARQWHPDFSPLGWHFGHIAFTEALWLLSKEEQAKYNPPHYQQLFRADGLPKAQRCQLPSTEIIQDYLNQVREAVWQRLETSWDAGNARLWWWLLQHEVQHSETISFLSHIAHIELGTNNFLDSSSEQSLEAEMVAIPAGGFWQGSNHILSQDNERPTHWVELEQFWLDKYPVTQAQYQQFIAAGGYKKEKYWTKAGWQWRVQGKITEPLHWPRQLGKNNHPVYGVSAYEAEAYANFVGKRLPTEAEWEKAARSSVGESLRSFVTSQNYQELSKISPENANFNNYFGQPTPVNYYGQGKNLSTGCQDLLGNVWEWTSSTFAPYDNFQPYPYTGYSQAYFDGEHRVLRGGSWATRPWGLRPSFRNWYHPWTRQILVGFRCAS